MLIAYLHQLDPSPPAFAARRRRLLLVAGLALLAPAFLWDHEVDTNLTNWGLTLLDLGYGCILLAAISTPAEGGMRSRPARLLAFLGFYSDPLYLWHADLALAPARKLFGGSWAAALPPSVLWPLAMTTYIGAATAAGITMSMLIERPTLALRDRLLPVRAAAPRAKDDGAVA